MKKRIFSLLLSVAMILSIVVLPANAFYVGIVSTSQNIHTGQIYQTLSVKKEDGSYEKLSVYDDEGNQYYIQVGPNEWEKLDPPLPAAEVAKREAEAAAAEEAARVQLKSRLEKTYRIRISEDYADSSSRLEELELNIEYIPDALWVKADAQLSKMGKTLKIEDMRNTSTPDSPYTGLYHADKVQIDLLPYASSAVFPHEYGHMIFSTILPHFYNSATLQKEWNALTGGEGPTHVSDYASTAYQEDLAETFQSMLTGYTEHYGSLKDLAKEYPDCLVIKKVNYLRQTLSKAFALPISIFPDHTPSKPSTWARAEIEEYEAFLDGSSDGVVPPSGMAHRTGYQVPATRLQFAYSISEDLVRNLWNDGFFKSKNISYAEYEAKWCIAPERVDGRYQIPFTDVDQSGSYYAIRAIYSLYCSDIIRGKSPTTFDPNGQITRQEAATILYRLGTALGYKFPKAKTEFADADKVASWAQEAVRAVSAAGIMNGVGDNQFDPTGVYTCEQSALCLLRTYKLLCPTSR